MPGYSDVGSSWAPICCPQTELTVDVSPLLRGGEKSGTFRS